MRAWPLERYSRKPATSSSPATGLGDTYPAIKAKPADYRELGVAHVWLLDPGARALDVYTGESLVEGRAFSILEFNLVIPKEELFR